MKYNLSDDSDGYNIKIRYQIGNCPVCGKDPSGDVLISGGKFIHDRCVPEFMKNATSAKSSLESSQPPVQEQSQAQDT